jgi:Arc/MetJ-type ribon-helix-helix transcriptional regulator
MRKGQSTTRITVDLNERLYARLERLEESTEASSKADVIRDALKLYERMVEWHLSGHKFLLQRVDEPPCRIELLGLPVPENQTPVESSVRPSTGEALPATKRS